MLELESGIFREVSGADVLENDGNEIPCRPDAKFGSLLELTYPVAGRVLLPIAIEITEPPVPGHRDASTTVVFDEPFSLPFGISSFKILVVNEFRGDEDLVDGLYVVRLIHPGTKMAYWSRTFHLRNCEARTAA